MWWPVVKVTFAGKFKNSGISPQESPRCFWTEPDFVGNRRNGSTGARGLGGAVGETEKEAHTGGGTSLLSQDRTRMVLHPLSQHVFFQRQKYCIILFVLFTIMSYRILKVFSVLQVIPARAVLYTCCGPGQIAAED